MNVDVLVIGAGPAGSAAARTAALRGLSVALVDRAEFPRDKVCGDGLIADALRVIDTLGLSPRVLPHATTVSGVQLYAPNRSLVDLAGTCVCVPRKVLDNTLREAAVDAGATFIARLKAVAPIVDGDLVCGAIFRHTGTDEETAISARLTLLATGAAAEPLMKFGVCQRMEPSATAARVYVDVAPNVAASVRQLLISFDASICPGYGWVFPIGTSRFNIGVGFFYDAWRMPTPPNTRVLLDAFLTTFPPAADLLRHATSVTPLRGAPMRTAMTGAQFARRGLLVIGEAAGTTYSLTGEGIGKAMETGVLAAEIAATHLRNGHNSLGHIASTYESTIRQRYMQKFKGYQRAQAWMTSRRLANFLAKRANAGSFVRGQLEGMFADTVDPQRLLSPLGIVRAILQ